MKNSEENPKLIDHHVHTIYCGHAEGTLEDYVASAGEAGLGGVGFCDHLPFLAFEDRSLAMCWEELPRYVDEVLRLAGKEKSPAVKLGIEADYFPGQEETLYAIFRNFPFDYVYGSIHFIEGWGFDDSRNVEKYEGLDVNDFYRKYYNLVVEMAVTGLFDVWAHPDLPKKFRYRPDNQPVELVEAALEAIAANGMALEVNTGGLRKPVGEVYPEPWILEIANRAGVPICFGSDAHKPEYVGAAFVEAVKLVRSSGYESHVTFKGRRPVELELPT
ncbi:MAG: histidinol-phosphatase HisJ family protein [Candidatus Coatesbacteria bacterium]|nr:MAG: histidinol-phosphatase HisJ family protein [Candidatus Coatesbacteria bacterium]